jgi:hypothetical protein
VDTWVPYGLGQGGAAEVVVEGLKGVSASGYAGSRADDGDSGTYLLLVGRDLRGVLRRGP